MNGGPSTSGKPYSNLAFFLLSVGDRPVQNVQWFGWLTMTGPVFRSS